jgi:Flp pilus assembly protein TadG
VKQRTLKQFKNDNGQSLVETALTLPIFILILCGILDFGWLFTNQLLLNNCSREAARFAVVNSDDPNFQTVVINKAKSFVLIGDPNDVTVTVSLVKPEVTITVDRTVPVLTPIVGAFYTNNQAELTSTTTMRVG